MAEKKRTPKCDRRRVRPSRTNCNEAFHEWAGKLGNIGAWRLSLDKLEVELDDAAKIILAASPDYRPQLAEFIASFREDFRLAIEQAFAEAVIQQRSFELELPLKYGECDVRWIRVAGGVCPKKNKTLQILGVIQDISAQRMIEALEQKHRERLTLATESAGLGLWEWNLTTNELDCDRTTKLIFGVVEASVMDLAKLRNIVYPSDRESFDIELSAFKEQVGDFHTQFRIINPHRGVRFIKLDGYRLKPERDNGNWAVGVVTDVTDTHYREEQLRQSEERNALALWGADLGSWDWHLPTGSVVYNERWANMLGYSLEELEPHVGVWERMLHSEDFERVHTLLEDYFAGKTASYEAEYRLRCKSGSWKWILDRGRIFERDSSGRPLRMIGTHLDIDDRKQKTAQVESAILEAQSANAARAQFLATMSHEIRTPLTAILGFAEAARGESVQPGDRLAAFDTIISNANHLLEVINDILDFSKIDAGALEIERGPVCAIHVVEDVCAMLKAKVTQKRLTLTIIHHWPLPQFISTDELRFKQILVNVIGNAIKFTDRGRVTVSLGWDAPSESLTIAVEDTGRGIAKESIPRLFEAFTQADASTSRRYGGSGLGLAITSRLLTMLGGSIVVDSELHRGSKFSLLIPGAPVPALAFVKEVPPRRAEAEVEEETEAGELLGSVLVAEDAADNQKLIEFMLRDTGIKTTFVNNGVEAVDAATVQHFDLIFMDISMPEMDGYTATKLLRSRGIRTPIVALTANTMAQDISKALESGCTAHLAKPFRKKMLFDTLSQYLHPDVKASLLPESVTSSVDEDPAMHALISEFVQHTKDYLEEIRQALLAKDYEAVAARAHKLCGSAGIYGYPELSSTAKQIQTAIHAKHLSELLPLMERMDKLYRAMVRGLQPAELQNRSAT